MAEEIATAPKSELTPDQKVSLAKIELGTDYTAKVSVGGYTFKIQYPSSVEDQLIMVEEERQYMGIRYPSENLRLSAIMWATLDIVVKEIYKVDGETSPKKLQGTFSSLFKALKNPKKVYNDIVGPLYIKYMEFENKLNSEVDPLKNL